MKLKEIRKSRNLLQNKVAADLNLSVKTYSTYETGRCNPDMHTLCMLADYFNVTLDYLLGRESCDNSLFALATLPKKSEIEELYNQLNGTQKELAKTFIKGLLASKRENQKKYNN